jgi:hypothetical protein
MLPWIQLIQQRVPYTTTGPNVAKEHFNIQCPFCGEADPSKHLGIHLVSGKWGCWRDADHRGSRPHRLLRAIFGWSQAEIQPWVSDQMLVDRTTMDEVIALLQDGEITPNVAPVQTYTLPDEFKLLDDRPTTRPYVTYLQKRGVVGWDIYREFHLGYAPLGQWSHRILLPIYNEEGVLQTMTGRAIGSMSHLRYLTASTEVSAPIKHQLYHAQVLGHVTGKVLVITEGPFDAVRLDWIGRHVGIRATCVFGSGMSPVQLSTLFEWHRRFDQVVFAYDTENFASSLRDASLASFARAYASVPEGKDFGEMSDEALEKWCAQLLTEKEVKHEMIKSV